MRNFLIFFWLSVFAVIVACIFSLPIYNVFDLSEIEKLNKQPGRITKWLAIIAISIVLTVAVRMRNVASRVVLGLFPAPKNKAGTLLSGFLLGIAILSPYAVLLYALDIYVVDLSRPAAEMLIKSVLFIIPALMISCIEEMYFRGILFYDLIQDNKVVAAVVLPSLLYSAVHFLNTKVPFSTDMAWWEAGLDLIVRTPDLICTNHDCWGAGITLFLVGVFLAMLRLYGASLFTCIGVHSGFIVVIKSTKNIFNLNGDSELSWLVKGPDDFIGLLSICWAGLALVMFYLWRKRISTVFAKAPVGGHRSP